MHKVLIALFLALAVSCSHAPVARQLSPEEFRHEAEQAIAEFLRTQPEVNAVNSVKMIETQQEREGLVHVAYLVSFESQSKEFGKTTQSYVAEADIESDGQGRWTIKNTRPRTQDIVYHDPTVITSGSPKKD